MFFEPKEVVLRSERTKTDRRFLAARYKPRGDLIFEGHDIGEGVKAFWGGTEYEWAWTIKAHDVPKLMQALNVKRKLLSALRRRFSGPNASNIEGFLKANEVPYLLWSRVGGYSAETPTAEPATQAVASSDGKRQYSQTVEPELTLPESIDGLIAFKSRAGIEIKVESGSGEAFFRLLLWLPYGYRLGFYDQYQNNSGGEDDPGVFVSITRKGATFAYMTGNHGWSSRWVFQSPEVLAAWMALNLRPAGAHPSPLRTIDVSRMPMPPFDGW